MAVMIHTRAVHYSLLSIFFSLQLQLQYFSLLLPKRRVCNRRPLPIPSVFHVVLVRAATAQVVCDDSYGDGDAGADEAADEADDGGVHFVFLE